MSRDDRVVVGSDVFWLVGLFVAYSLAMVAIGYGVRSAM